MKQCSTFLLVAVAGLISVGSAFAGSVGLVDMRELAQNSPKIQKLNKSLNAQFVTQRQSLEKLANAYQADAKQLKRNKSVMDKKDLEALTAKIAKERNDLQSQQAKLSQAMFKAQSEAMKKFTDSVNDASKEVAMKQGLDLVLYKNFVLYSKNSKDVTKQVEDAMK